VYLPKRDSAKMRPRSIPAMTDRAMQALYLLALEPLAETRGEPNSSGFRTARSPADATAPGFNGLAKRQSPPWIWAGDIRACFDTISHAWLLAHLPMEKAILQKWLCAGYLERHVFHPTEQGTPPGGTCSPVLANLPRDGLEPRLRTHYPKAKRAGKRAQVTVIRFADDFIVTGRTKALLEEEVKPLLEQFLRERGLELSAEKTRIIHLEDGVDFLGQNLRKYRGKLLIKPAKRHVQAFLAKGIIKAHKQAPAGTLVLLLNPVIRGWACLHQHVVSKHTFRAVDQAIFHTLWHWARRRHPTKPTRWVKAHYFDPVGGRHWVFHGAADGAERQLFAASSIAITRHIKVKGEANPFDPAWEGYFEHRLQVKMANTLKGRRQLLSLWKAQDGRCPICHQPITESTGWHSHHLIWRSKGGPDTAVNRVRLHPECHREVHSRQLLVVKPRPIGGGGVA
jgi:RNA-directed DNA polymerase